MVTLHPQVSGLCCLLAWGDGSGSSLPAPCSVPPFPGSCTFNTLKGILPGTQIIIPKGVLSGMDKSHPIAWAAVKHKAQLTALAGLTPACITSTGYLPHLTTHLALLYTWLHGWFRSHWGLSMDGLCWSRECFSLSYTQSDLELSLVSLLSCILVSSSFLIKFSYLTP